MKSRVRYKNRPDSHCYVGVSMCDRWWVFENFLADMGERPNGTSLDRFPNNKGNYEPGNCRWATRAEQTRNRRTSKLTFDDAVAIAMAVFNGENSKVVATRYGCCPSTPRQIAMGRSWPDAHAEARRRMENPNER